MQVVPLEEVGYSIGVLIFIIVVFTPGFLIPWVLRSGSIGFVKEKTHKRF